MLLICLTLMIILNLWRHVLYCRIYVAAMLAVTLPLSNGTVLQSIVVLPYVSRVGSAMHLIKLERKSSTPSFSVMDLTHYVIRDFVLVWPH